MPVAALPSQVDKPVSVVSSTPHATATGQAALRRHPHKTTLSPLLGQYELPRKLWHSSIGFFVLFYYHFFNVTVWRCLAWLLPLSLSYIVLDFFRLSDERLNRPFCRLLAPFLRASEKRTMTASSFFFAGVLTVLLTAPNPKTAILCILYLSWSDTVACVFGRFYSSTATVGSSHSRRGEGILGITWWEARIRLLQAVRFGNRRGRRQTAASLSATKPPAGSKSIVGSLACFLFSAFLTFAFLVLQSTGSGIFLLLNVSVRAGLIVTLAELVGGTSFVGGVDDDFIIPVMSCILLRMFTSIPRMLAS